MSAPDKNINTPKNQYQDFQNDAFEKFFDAYKKSGTTGARLGWIKDTVKKGYDREFAKKYGEDKIGSADYNEAFNNLYQNFLKNHNLKDGNDYVKFR